LIHLSLIRTGRIRVAEEKIKYSLIRTGRIRVAEETTFDKVIISKKKHYLGIVADKDKEPIVKGFEGIKSDRVE